MPRIFLPGQILLSSSGLGCILLKAKKKSHFAEDSLLKLLLCSSRPLKMLLVLLLRLLRVALLLSLVIRWMRLVLWLC
jgi:hypothetical protein